MIARHILFAAALGAAIPATASSAPCKVDTLAEQSLGYSEELLPTIRGSIEGHPATLLLDSGSTTTVVNGALARLAALPLSQPTAALRGIGGEVSSSKSNTQFEWALAPRAPIALRVVEQFSVSPQSDGALGAGQLFNDRVDLSFADRRLRLLKLTGACAAEDLGGPQASMQERLAGPVSDPRLYLSVEVNGIPMRALVDTGSRWTTLLRGAAERAGFTPHGAAAEQSGQSEGLGAQRLQAWTSPFDLAVAGQRYPAARLRVIDALPESTLGKADLLLGLDWLHAHRLIAIAGTNQVAVMRTSPDVFTRPLGGRRSVAGQAGRQRPA